MNKNFILFTVLSFASINLFAQQQNENDTFFLSKKKGLLGRLGRSITTNPAVEEPVKFVDPFKMYNGKIIRSVEIIRIGFNQNFNDTTEIHENFATRAAKKFHKNTRESVIKKHLFFDEGDVFLPLLISDNERYLRELPFIQDAVIVVNKFGRSKDSIDLIVMTKDVFSLGASINAGSVTKVKTEFKEENLGGTGNYVGVTNIYDKGRNPTMGRGASFIKRNINGSFLNFTAGLTNFNPAFNSGLNEESSFYTSLEKPLVSRYTQWTGTILLQYNKTFNAYLNDSLYVSDFQYKYKNVDVWGGYNFGSRFNRLTDSEKRLRHFIAARTFYNKFENKPQIYTDSFDYKYADINGLLFSYSLYKQNFYRTNFIYGFGRNEDVPTGINTTIIAGWANKENKRRGYLGFDFEGNKFSEKGNFNSYVFRAGGFAGKGYLEDINFLWGFEHFTKLKKLAKSWVNRSFISFSHAMLFKKTLNEPLILESKFGLPYFPNGTNFGNARTTIKFESVFINFIKFYGFRLAPFAFTEVSFLKPIHEPINRTNGFSAIGGGLRTRNENLIFGTMEVRGYIFPRITPGMQSWKVDFTTNLRFKYNSSFIKKPDFVSAN